MQLSGQSKAFGILLSVGALALLAFTNCGCSLVKSDELDIQGVQFMKQHEWAKAIEKFTASIKMNPDHAVSYLRRGNSYLALSQYDPAVADYNKALSFKDQSDLHKCLAYEGRGVAYLNTGKFKEGLDDETSAINLTPRPIAYFNRGRCKSALKDFHGALSDYEEGLKLDPNSVIGLSDLGVERINLKDYKGAIDALNQALNLKMDDQIKCHDYVMRGIAEYDSHNYKEAIADDDKALQMNGNDSEALQDRGNAKLALGDKSGAEQDYAASKKATYTFNSFHAHINMHPED
jgi:tetratricopeptide (TPR) repeat protein